MSEFLNTIRFICLTVSLTTRFYRSRYWGNSPRIFFLAGLKLSGRFFRGRGIFGGEKFSVSEYFSGDILYVEFSAGKIPLGRADSPGKFFHGVAHFRHDLLNDVKLYKNKFFISNGSRLRRTFQAEKSLSTGNFLR